MLFSRIISPLRKGKAEFRINRNTIIFEIKGATIRYKILSISLTQKVKFWLELLIQKVSAKILGFLKYKKQHEVFKNKHYL